MFVTTTRRRFGHAGRIEVTLAIGRSVMAALIEREGLIFASRFAPSTTHRPDRAYFYLLLEGRLQVDGRVHDAPVALWLAEADAEGGTLDWVNVGAPLRAVELRFPLDRVVAPFCGVWTPDADTVVAAAAARANPRSVPALVDALARAGLVRPEPPVGADASVHRRIWGAVGPLTSRFELLGSLEQVADEAGVSVRSVARDLLAFTREHVVPFESWRNGTRQFRLKMAVIGLSAADMPIGEVAKAVGYGSVDAMARAFRDAGQPAPRDVRRILLELGAALSA